MRLIDADELEARVINFQGRGKKTFLEMLASQPTAYDPDKVVEQLEQFQDIERLTGRGYCPEIDEEDSERSCLTSELGCGYCAFEKAIKIVKKGGAI